jgi:hypothetical protein
VNNTGMDLEIVRVSKELWIKKVPMGQLKASIDLSAPF